MNKFCVFLGVTGVFTGTMAAMFNDPSALSQLNAVLWAAAYTLSVLFRHD